MKKWLKYVPSYIPSVVVTMVLFYFTLMPDPLPEVDAPFGHIDKLVHVVMMFGVYMVYAFDYKSRERQHLLPLPVMIALLVITIVLGGLIELAQGTDLINRGCDLYDFLADSVGAIVAFAVCRPLLARLFK